MATKMVFPSLQVKRTELSKLFKTTNKLHFHFYITSEKGQPIFKLMVYKKGKGTLFTNPKNKSAKKKSGDEYRFLMKNIVPGKETPKNTKPLFITPGDQPMVLNELVLTKQLFDKIPPAAGGHFYFIPFLKKFNPEYVCYTVNATVLNPCPPCRP